VFLRPWASLFGAERFLRVEEFAEDGTLVVRADLPGIDPDKDVEISLADHMLTIEAERRVEEQTEQRRYVCSELRYGSFSRSITVPDCVTETDIKASYRDGVLEVRIPYPGEKPAIRVPVAKGELPAKAASWTLAGPLGLSARPVDLLDDDHACDRAGLVETTWQGPLSGPLRYGYDAIMVVGRQSPVFTLLPGTRLDVAWC
jgi:HSP20 family protein